VTQEANNNVVIISGLTLSQDIIGVQEISSTDATCLIVSNIENTTSSILSAILQQTNAAATDIFGGGQAQIQTNIFDIEQSIVNNISQINEATCASSTTKSASNNYFYAQNSKGRNFIGVQSIADASANCSMTNTMKNATYNQAQASATQSNTEVGMFVAIFAAIAAIVGLLVLGVIILYSTGVIGHKGDRREGYAYERAPEPRLTPEERELKEAADLGLTPELLQSLTEPQAVA